MHGPAPVSPEARLRGDRPADALIERLGARAWAACAVLRGVRRNDQPLPPALPAEAMEFLASVLPPPWLDRTRVLRAQRWAHEHLLPITTALFCASLPSAYAAERGARVLAATGRLDTDIDRRVNETARFVLDVLEPGAFEPAGNGIRAVQRTRLVHAVVRGALVARSWPPDEIPINQEDLLGTLLTFSVVVVRAVRRLGVAADARAAEDYFHLWRGVGAMLGLEAGLLPDDFVQASAMTDQLARQHFRASEHGRALMAALLARLEAHVPGLPAAPRWLVRHLAGDVVADLLGIAADGGLPAPLALAGRFPWPAGRAAEALLARATTLLARPVLETIVASKLNGA